jgi:hypothetical protein
MLDEMETEKLAANLAARMVSALLPPLGIGMDDFKGSRDAFDTLMTDMSAWLEKMAANPFPLDDRDAYVHDAGVVFFTTAKLGETAHLEEPPAPGSYDVHLAGDLAARLLFSFETALADNGAGVTAADILSKWFSAHAQTREGNAWLLNKATEMIVADSIDDDEGDPENGSENHR